MKIDQNTVALVTGGASGLGEATVIKLLALGAKVFVADLDEKKGKAIEAEFGVQKCRFFKTDVANEENVIQLIAEIKKTFGNLHIVVNSAGVATVGLIAKPDGQTIHTDKLRRVLNINVIGTFNVVKHAAVLMIKQQVLNEYNERGVIINVASVLGIEGQMGQTFYSASKGAILGMTLPLARDLGKYGVRVIAIAPGFFHTPMTIGYNDKVKENLENSAALGRFGQPAEFGDCVIGLCTNSYITGEIIRLDGGIRLSNL